MKTKNKELNKVISFGKVAFQGTTKQNEVTIEVSLKYNKEDKPVFSASGNVWMKSKKDIYMGGQCIDTIYNEFSKELTNLPLYKHILGLWERNHLNDMNAGTKEQTQAIEEWESKGNRYDYTAVCEYLKSINMYEVDLNGAPYKYGHSWLYRDISTEDLNDIEKLFEN